MTDRYVSTQAIHSALKGRELELLLALGINWDAGSPHVHCPYPHHDDRNPSWRWDARRARAYCTCTEGSDSALDVLMKCEEVAFERVKVRAAELIGRTDLICIRGEGALTERRHQATDAASLLNAPRDNRDDGLPVAYLAHRLGVDVGAVPIPSTPVVGLKALGYYDPPAPVSKAKPKLVREFPCGTVAADGRTHALGFMWPQVALARPTSAPELMASRAIRKSLPNAGATRALLAVRCCGAMLSGLSISFLPGHRDRRGGGAGVRRRDPGRGCSSCIGGLGGRD